MLREGASSRPFHAPLASPGKIRHSTPQTPAHVHARPKQPAIAPSLHLARHQACLGCDAHFGGLTPNALKYIDKFAAVLHQTTVGCSDYSQQAKLIDRLVQAVEERRIAPITYQSLRATEPVSYDIYPYGLTYHRGSLYLVGHAPDHNAVRHWKVDRVREVELSDLRFNRPADFDLQSHFAKSFGVFRGEGDGEVRVKVRFSPTVARYVSESR